MPLQTVRRTYLTLPARDAFRPRPHPPDAGEVTLADESGCTVKRWRALYADVGAAWHWHDRDAWTDVELRTRLDRPEVRVLTMQVNGALAGFAELERGEDGRVEVVLFGLLPEFMGRGLGAHFLELVVARAWEMDAAQVWLHTCTLDSPRALPNYLARGFVKEREEEYTVEVP